MDFDATRLAAANALGTSAASASAPSTTRASRAARDTAAEADRVAGLAAADLVEADRVLAAGDPIAAADLTAAVVAVG